MTVTSQPRVVAATRAVQQPAGDQDRQAGERRDAGERAHRRREDPVGVLADAEAVGPGLRDQDADHVAADHGEQADVEERAADLQPARLEQLRRARRPGELVAAVAPDVADDERRDREVGQDDPEERRAAADGERRHRTASVGGMTSGGANGSRPTSSSGGPSRAMRRASASSSALSGGSVDDDGVEHARRTGCRCRAATRAAARSPGRIRPSTASASSPGASAANSRIAGR